MKLKLDANGNVVVQDGKPVYVWEDGKETAVDAAGLFSKITELNKENKGHREKAEALEAKLAKYGDTDPDDIEAFLDEVDAMGGIEELRKMAEAGGGQDIGRIKQELESAYKLHQQKLEEGFRNQIQEREKVIADKDNHIYKLEVSNRFKSSSFIGSKLILPPDIAEATFGQNFKIEDGQVVAYLGGNKIYSREKPGELADFEEAITTIIEAYPMKDRILKGTNQSGSGAQDNKGNFNHAAMADMNPVARITAARAAGQKT